MAQGLPISILTITVVPGDIYIWEALPGYEIFDPFNYKFLYRIEYANTTNTPQCISVIQKDGLPLIFSHADMRPSFSSKPYIPKAIAALLPEPDFTLDEIELGRKIVDGM